MTTEDIKLPSLLELQNDFSNDLKLHYQDLNWDPESKAYEGCCFKFKDHDFHYRKAKITPTKTGQFVTVWKRSEGGSTEPYRATDGLDFLIIYTPTSNNTGFFLFPKKCLIKHAILSSVHKTGKLGFRVYPSWDITSNKQASQTKEWQEEYFFNLSNIGAINKAKFKNIMEAKY